MSPTALLSVSNKSGLVHLAKSLHEVHGFELLSSGGTANALEEAGLNVLRVSEYTGAPEILEGRVKTLHPRIHGGILAKRGEPSHESDIKQQEISLIDLVVVNLYPFTETIANPESDFLDGIENIDIGGPAMIRAAAKNHLHVSVLTSPNQYEEFLAELKENNGDITTEFRLKLALEAFEHTASYDVAISNWLKEKFQGEPSTWLEARPLKQKLRYGENPHQKASWYSEKLSGWGAVKQLQGKELSTNNLLDLDAALSTVREFGYGDSSLSQALQPAAVIIKHTNPCGVGIGNDLFEAFGKALSADSVSAFGGIVALNTEVDESTAKDLTKLFLECVVAPKFSQKAIEILSSKTNLRLLELNQKAIISSDNQQIRSILGGALIQELDNKASDPSLWKTVTDRKPTEKQKDDLRFAWNVVKHVRSNAILIAKAGKTLGIGAGQMNRVGSAKIAIEAAGEEAKGAVLASDGFFPFNDTVHLAAQHGIEAIVQPGGSIRDKDSISACNQFGISMLTTGTRHFLH